MARGVVHEPFPSLNDHDHLWDRMSFLILRMRERLFTSINEVIRYVKKKLFTVNYFRYHLKNPGLIHWRI